MFFVMLTIHCANGKIRIAPLMDDEEVMLFETYEQADACALDNPLGAAHGFEIFDIEI